MAALDAREAKVLKVVAEEAAAFIRSYAVARQGMTAGNWLHLWGDEKLAPMELYDIGGRVKELPPFGSREDVGDLSGVKSIRAEKFEER